MNEVTSSAAVSCAKVFLRTVLTVYHACSHVFAATSCVKIVENQMGRAYVKSQQVLMQMVAPGQIPAGIPMMPPGDSPGAPLPS